MCERRETAVRFLNAIPDRLHCVQSCARPVSPPGPKGNALRKFDQSRPVSWTPGPVCAVGTSYPRIGHRRTLAASGC
jgi:hypothetical protein